MEVKITNTSLIHPSSQPFSFDHTLSLSHLDNDPNLNTTFRYLRAYASAAITAQPFDVISAALSSALVSYYPLAGSLRRRKIDNRLELHCQAGQAVPLINATVDCTLESVNYIDDPTLGFVEQLVPNLTREESMSNPFVLQVTVFKCGGWTLGTVVHHALCDGVGGTQVFSAMAELARGSGQISVKPVWDRKELLGPRDPPMIESPVSDFLQLGNGFEPYVESSSVVKVCLIVKEECLKRFKSSLLHISGLSFTTFEALGAYIWRAEIKASNIPREENVKFVYSINIRKLTKPPLPFGYWGNGCIPMYAQLAAGDLIDQPIWKTAELIKQSKINACDSYVRSFIDFQEVHYKDGISGGTQVSGFTDWRHLGHSGLDFGWGAPVNVLPLSTNLLGSVEPCFFLPAVNVDDAFKVLLNLRQNAVPAFREEMDKFAKGDFPSSL